MSEEPPTPPWTEVRGSSGPSDPVGSAATGDAARGPADRIRSAEGLLVLVDFDGTLADVEPRPEQAQIRPASRAALADLAERPRTGVAVVSGRGLDDVRERVGLGGIAYAGNHGLEIETPGRGFVHPEAERAAETVDAVCASLRDRLADVEGAIVEHKELSATVHYRQVAAGDVERVRRVVHEVVETIDAGGTSESGRGTGSGRAPDDGPGESDDPESGALRVEGGKEILELKPDVDWDKGRAVEWLRDVLVPDGGTWHPIYVGDDVTDEDAFRALEGVGTSVRVGSPEAETAADCLVDGPEAVTALLEWLAEVRDSTGDSRA